MFQDAYRTGLTTEQFLDMDLWQYNAWCEAFKLKQCDTLATMVQAAYLEAYWNGASKHKKSLDRILKDLYKGVEKSKPRKIIDFKDVDKEFKQMEELRTNGCCVE